MAVVPTEQLLVMLRWLLRVSEADAPTDSGLCSDGNSRGSRF